MAEPAKEMNLRYPGRCASCGAEIPQGARAMYDPSSRSVRHVECDTQPGRGVAGTSAYREYDRRTARDRARIEDHKARVEAVYGSGFIGKIATFIEVDDRPRRSTEVWAQGAVGEERVATYLDQLFEVGVIPLHDRRIPGTRANIDHLAVTPWGVWVIDAKRYLNKRPDFVTEGRLFGIGGTSRLTVGGRRKDDLIDGVLRQAGLVKEVVGDRAPVSAALAFVDADWPLIGGDFAVRGVAVLWPKRLAKVMLRKEPPAVDVVEVAELLAARFPPA